MKSLIEYKWLPTVMYYFLYDLLVSYQNSFIEIFHYFSNNLIMEYGFGWKFAFLDTNHLMQTRLAFGCALRIRKNYTRLVFCQHLHFLYKNPVVLLSLPLISFERSEISCTYKINCPNWPIRYWKNNFWKSDKANIFFSA